MAIFGHFAKALSKVLETSSYPHFDEINTNKYHCKHLVCNWSFADIFPTNVVRTQVLWIVRMRKENTKRAVPLDAVPERRTERCSPRFRPGDRFGEPSFRYLSPGIEGEKCRPLDHMWQIPFIHSVRFRVSSSFYIYGTVSELICPCGTFKCVLVWCIFHKYACALAEKFVVRFTAIV